MRCRARIDRRTSGLSPISFVHSAASAPQEDAPAPVVPGTGRSGDRATDLPMYNASLRVKSFSAIEASAQLSL
jgi:hypothetical protein